MTHSFASTYHIPQSLLSEEIRSLVHQDALVLKIGCVYDKCQSYDYSKENISLSSGHVGCHDGDVTDNNARQSDVDKEKELICEEGDMSSSMLLIDIRKMFQEKNQYIDAKSKSFDDVIDRKFKEQRDYFVGKLKAITIIKVETFVV